MKILILNDREPIDKAILESLKKEHDVVLWQYSPDNFDINQALSTHGDADILVATYMPLNNTNLAKLKNLKHIVATTTATEYIDTDYCRDNNITVVNNTGYTESAVAEHLFALMLSAGRKIISLDKGLRAGDFNQFDKPGFEFNQKTLGVIGFGYIGQQFASYANVLGMNVIYFNRSVTTSGHRQVSLDELLRQADVIALTLPLTKETHHLLDKKAFETMKDDAIIVSISSDDIIDQAALVDALKANRLFACGFDKHEKNDALNQFDNVIMTPTKAWYTKECMERRNASWMDSLQTLL